MKTEHSRIFEILGGSVVGYWLADTFLSQKNKVIVGAGAVTEPIKLFQGNDQYFYITGVMVNGKGPISCMFDTGNQIPLDLSKASTMQLGLKSTMPGIYIATPAGSVLTGHTPTTVSLYDSLPITNVDTVLSDSTINLISPATVAKRYLINIGQGGITLQKLDKPDMTPVVQRWFSVKVILNGQTTKPIDAAIDTGNNTFFQITSKQAALVGATKWEKVSVGSTLTAGGVVSGLQSYNASTMEIQGISHVLPDVPIEVNPHATFSIIPWKVFSRFGQAVIGPNYFKMVPNTSSTLTNTSTH